MQTIIHRCRVWAGLRPAHILTKMVVICLSCLLLLWVLGCGGAGQSIDALFVAANSQLADARKAGAEQYAEPQLEEAVSLMAQAEVAVENKDKGARILMEKALAKARLAEALARQLKAENETAQLEMELEKVSSEASQARQERQAAKNKLTQMASE